MEKGFGRRLLGIGPTLIIAACLTLAPQTPLGAQGARLGRVTGFELPRYVSLRASKARLRVGPGTKYPIKWVYIRPGIPLEIIAEYGNWRKVRDWSSAMGWMYQSLLSGRRTAVVAPWQTDLVPLRREQSKKAVANAMLSPGVIARLERCGDGWCRISVENGAWHGFVVQAKLWGAYPGELLE